MQSPIPIPTWYPGLTHEQLVNDPIEVELGQATIDALQTGGSGASGGLTNTELRQTPLATTDTLNGTRVYNWSAGTRETFTTTSTAALVLPTLGSRREARFICSSRCFVRFGVSGVGAAAVAAGQAIFPADCPEVIVIPVGTTHYRVIGETAGGSISITPVA